MVVYQDAFHLGVDQISKFCLDLLSCPRGTLEILASDDDFSRLFFIGSAKELLQDILHDGVGSMNHCNIQRHPCKFRLKNRPKNRPQSLTLKIIFDVEISRFMFFVTF